jgi:hypothetical protein
LPTSAQIYNQAVTDLASVRAAIARIIGTTTEGGAQALNVGGTQLQRAQLSELYKERDRLQGIVNRYDPANGGGAVSYPLFANND